MTHLYLTLSLSIRASKSLNTLSLSLGMQLSSWSRIAGDVARRKQWSSKIFHSSLVFNGMDKGLTTGPFIYLDGGWAGVNKACETSAGWDS